MGLAADGYYSFARVDGGHNGLVRVSGGEPIFERVESGAWVKDRDLARHFVNPGSTFLEPVDDATAQRLATRYGVRAQ
jgi:hypothetical protein